MTELCQKRDPGPRVPLKCKSDTLVFVYCRKQVVANLQKKKIIVGIVVKTPVIKKV